MNSKNIEYWIRLLRLPFTGVAGAVFVANNKNTFGIDTAGYWIFVGIGLLWIIGGSYIDAIQAIRVLKPVENSLIPIKMGKLNVGLTLVVAGVLFVSDKVWTGNWFSFLSNWYKIPAGLLCLALLGIILLYIVSQSRNIIKGKK